MINKFISNIISMGFYNIFLYAAVLILIHIGIAFLLANVEKMHGAKVQFYWYDIPISFSFIFLFIYGIYDYKD